MSLLINWIISALVLICVAYVLPGVHILNFFTALVAALILGIINAVLKPILVVLTLPINILTLGLFTLIINAVLIMLTASLVPGFTIDSFWWALALGIALSIVNSVLHQLTK